MGVGRVRAGRLAARDGGGLRGTRGPQEAREGSRGHEVDGGGKRGVTQRTLYKN